MDPIRLKDWLRENKASFDLTTQEDAHELLLFLLERIGEENNRGGKRKRGVEKRGVGEKVGEKEGEGEKGREKGMGETADKKEYQREESLKEAEESTAVEGGPSGERNYKMESCKEQLKYLSTRCSIVEDLLLGQTIDLITCQHCGYRSPTYTPFTVLELPVPDMEKASLLDCFKEMSKEEVIDCLVWVCPKCNQRRKAKKFTSVMRLPPVLIIYLKRMGYNHKGFYKNNCLIKMDLRGEDLSSCVFSSKYGDGGNKLPGTQMACSDLQSARYKPIGFIVSNFKLTVAS